MSYKTIRHFVFDYNQKLGEGSTGTVYLGTDLRNNQLIAVKAIQLKNIDNEVTQYLLKNEIKALQITTHPNVLRAIDVVQQPEFVYIVTDYLPCGTLADYIQRLGSIPEAEALEIFKQIVDGYDHISDLHIYHRDLKPHNILFDSNFRPVISDFGYCEITGFLPKPKLQYNVGSPGFMAPESIVGNLYSENSEVWSLGAILYEMMTGRNYTNGKPVMEAVMLIKKQGPYYPETASPLTKMILKESMMLRPQERMKVKTLKQLLHQNLRSPAPAQIPYAAQQAVYLTANGEPVVMNVNPNQGANVFNPETQRLLMNGHNAAHLIPHPNMLIQVPFQAQMAPINVPQISGAKQTNVVTLSKIPISQPPANQIQNTQQATTAQTNALQQTVNGNSSSMGSNKVHPMSMPNANTSGQHNIIRNVSAKKRGERESAVGANKTQQQALLSGSQPLPGSGSAHLSATPQKSTAHQESRPAQVLIAQPISHQQQITQQGLVQPQMMRSAQVQPHPQHMVLKSPIQPTAQASKVAANIQEMSFSPEREHNPFYMPNMGNLVNHGYEVMNVNNPFMLQKSAQKAQPAVMQQQQVQSAHQIPNAQPYVEIPSHTALQEAKPGLDVQRAQLQQQIQQQQLILQQQALQQQALQQQILHQNQLIMMQQQALAQQATQVQQIVDPVTNTIQQVVPLMTSGQYNLPGARISLLGQNVINPIVFGTQLSPQVSYEFITQAPQMIIAPQQAAQIPQVQTSHLQQVAQVPSQQVLVQQHMLTSNHSLNPVNHNYKGSFAQAPVIIHPVPQFGSQYMNVIVPSGHNYYGI